jgi:DNA-binding MarR family transcriptional regulator
MSVAKSRSKAKGPSPELLRLLQAGTGAFREYLTAEVMYAQAVAQALGLGAIDFFGLNVITLTGSMTAGQLAERTGLTTGAATRLIDRLEQAGFARRVRDTRDRRRVYVELVPERQHEIDAVLEPGRARLGELFMSYDAAQVSVLLDYFTRATPILRELTAHMDTIEREQP